VSRARAPLAVAIALVVAGCGGGGGESSSPPEFGKTVDLSPVSGDVRVELAGTSTFDKLTGARQVPVGSVVDASAGVVKLSAARGTPAQIDSGEFQAGVFEIRQDAAEPDVTELRIRNDEGSRAACGGKPSKRLFGRLLGDAEGRFRTRGQHSAATVRGTAWGVRNRCDGTLTIVRRGTVVVTDFARHKNVVVHAGHSFLARAR
jgi:hypothetical protein